MGCKAIAAGILNEYQSTDETVLDRLLQEEIRANKMKIIVLDDDPTGVQTMHDISVYTDWTKESIESGFLEKNKLFYILTNSRAFTADQTVRVHKEIVRTVEEVSRRLGMDYMIMSRSDSTLRGHYPLEPDVLIREMEEAGHKKIDGEVLCFFFKECGRYTIGDTHYVRYGDELIPAGNTEFAGDKTFGYASSNLREYVEEKTEGRYRKEDVVSIPIASLRNRDIDGITERLVFEKGFRKIVVNAVDYCDLKVFCIALYRAIAQGKRYVFRTAASLVKAIGGVTDKPLLARNDMITKERAHGGIVVVGSHTQKTTSQLKALEGLSGLALIAFDSDLVLDEEKFENEIKRVVGESESLISAGKTVVIYTNRAVLTRADDTKESALLRSTKISDAVQSLVGRLSVTPGFVLAKGGITSSDIGTKALKVRRATVIGQAAPGVPVWKTGEESKFPGIPYIIFPGNVGEASTLREILEILLEKQ